MIIKVATRFDKPNKPRRKHKEDEVPELLELLFGVLNNSGVAVNGIDFDYKEE